MSQARIQRLAPDTPQHNSENLNRTTEIFQRPTVEAYSALETAFDYFNHVLFVRLFGARLPSVMITMPHSHRAHGYFGHQTWRGAQGRPASEIALNPAYFPDQVELCQTLVHEMVHHAQAELPDVYGMPDRTPGYHGKSFAKTMLALGLMPSSTGKPGGDTLGYRMGDYPIPGGPFEATCRDFLDGGNGVAWSFGPLRSFESLLDLLATGPSAAPSVSIVRARKRASKTKYSCPTCHMNAWAKPAAHLICGACRLDLIAVNTGA